MIISADKKIESVWKLFVGLFILFVILFLLINQQSLLQRQFQK